MRKFYLNLAIGGLLWVLTGCSATNELTISILEPAPVDLSHNIKRIGIIDESMVFEKDEYQNRIDQIVSTKDHQLAREGTDAAINGLFDELLKDKRFDTILLLDNAPEIMNDSDVLSNAISWSTIKSLCDTYKVDAIFSLAFYETDTRVSLRKTKMEQQDLMRVKVKVPAHEITLETLIENGWRIYDPYNKQVLDEITFNDQIISSAMGVNPLKALQAIDDRKDSVLHKSKYTGSAYGLRLQPYKHSISRDYYISGTDNFVIAHERVQMGDWRGAKELWEQEVTHSKPKIRGRACFNMAVINEFNGDLETAMDWATKSYDNYKGKSALRYIDALEYRITQNNLLQQQLAFNEISK